MFFSLIIIFIVAINQIMYIDNYININNDPKILEFASGKIKSP